MSDPIEAFRAAERALYTAHRLLVKEHFLDLPKPVMRARVVECGDGPATLYVHGGGGFGALWAPLVAAIPERRHIVVDRPGCGLSEFVPTDGDFRAHAVEFLSSTLDALRLDRVDIVANSMGGLWSLWLALDRSDRVRTLALVGAPAMVGGGSAPLPMRLLGRPIIGKLMMMLEPPSAKQVKVLWQRMGHDPTSLDATIHDVMLAAERLPAYAPAWRALLARALTVSGPAKDVVFQDADLARLRCPVTFVWGKEDPFGGAEFGRSVAAKTPGSRFEVAGVGHLPWLDDPAGCARAILPALAPATRRAA